MAESFLEEQLRRIKNMTEQMSRIHALRYASELRDPEPNDSSAAAEPVRQPRRTSSRGTRRRGR
jgi:hypothetical protein